MVLRCRTSETTQLLESVLEAAIDRSRWPTALARLTEAADGISANLTAVSFRQPEHGFLISSGLDEDVGRLFLERYQDNMLSRAMADSPLGCPVDQTGLVNPKLFERTAFQYDIFRPLRIKSYVAVRLPISHQTDTGGVGVALNSTSARRVRRTIDVLSALAPALQHASAASLRLPSSGLPVVAVLETLPTAALVVDAKGYVSFMNAKAAAMARAGDGFDLRRRHLVVRDRADRAALMRLIGAATRMPLPRAFPSAACRVRRNNQKAPLIVHVCAMRDTSERLAVPGVPHAILFISRPEDDAEHSSVSESRLRTLFNLTQAEARVALGIAKGKNIPEVAQQLGVGDGTVHTHLHSVFEKTGLRRQSALARMLTRTGILDLP